MPIITLLSDWGLSDHYVAAVKGTILSRMPSATIIDISHNIKHFDIKHAAFVMNNSWRAFPEGTIHIVSIDSIESILHPHVAIKAEGHYFIGADTGLFSLILKNKPDEIVMLQNIQDTGYFTFPERDRFAKTAVHIAEGKPLGELGVKIDKLVTKILMEATFDNNIITGNVMHTDSYENIYTNISEEFVKQCFGSHPYYIKIRKGTYPKLVKAYGDIYDGGICALFAANGYLQIAINRGRASSLIGLKNDSNVYVIGGNEEDDL